MGTPYEQEVSLESLSLARFFIKVFPESSYEVWFGLLFFKLTTASASAPKIHNKYKRQVSFPEQTELFFFFFICIHTNAT